MEKIKNKITVMISVSDVILDTDNEKVDYDKNMSFVLPTSELSAILDETECKSFSAYSVKSVRYDSKKDVLVLDISDCLDLKKKPVKDNLKLALKLTDYPEFDNFITEAISNESSYCVE